MITNIKNVNNSDLFTYLLCIFAKTRATYTKNLLFGIIFYVTKIE